jgi:uncharacterized protein YkwD
MTHLTNLALISSITSLFFVGCGETSPTTSSTATQESMTKVITTSQVEILEAINNVRAEARDCNDGRGVVGPSVALTWSDTLYTSAYEHSNDLAVSDTFSHNGSGTASDVTGSNNGRASRFNERIKANGFVDYSIIGENIAGGQESIESVVTAWLASPAHCTNLMESEFREIGVAVVTNEASTYGIYWTQNFGAK